MSLSDVQHAFSEDWITIMCNIPYRTGFIAAMIPAANGSFSQGSKSTTNEDDKPRDLDQL